MNSKRNVEKTKRKERYLNMQYPFVCPNCGHEEKIDMPMRDYVTTGHYCPNCNTEMVREIKSLVCGVAIDQTGDFFKRTSI